jgi:non-ribosomal peptide synthetase component F
MTLLAAYNVILSKYTGQEDVIVGTPTAGRHHTDLKGIIGVFVNTLAMRNYPKGSKKFTEFLEEVKENSIKAYESQDYQFDDLVEKLELKRDLSRNPLFDTMLVLQNTDIPQVSFDNLRFIPYKPYNAVSKVDLSIEAVESRENIHFTIQYSTRLFREETIKNLAEHFMKVLEIICDKNDICIEDIVIIDFIKLESIVEEIEESQEEISITFDF